MNSTVNANYSQNSQKRELEWGDLEFERVLPVTIAQLTKIFMTVWVEYLCPVSGDKLAVCEGRNEIQAVYK